MTKAVSLLSGGLDSPVASWLMLREMELIFAYFSDEPIGDVKAVGKVKELAHTLANKSRKKIKFYHIPHGANQVSILKNCEARYLCLLSRRIQYRIAERIAKKDGAKVIVNGEALGQKASQTLQNLAVTDSAVRIPILRPLLGMDKEEIIRIAKQIKTYESSSYDSLCCMFNPDKPSTKACLEKIMENEKKINMKKLVSDSLNKSEVLYFSP